MSSVRYNGSPLAVGKRGELMSEPEEVAAMLALQAKGWGARRIARELGVSRNTVKRYLAAGGWVAYRRPERGSRLAGLEEWLRERFRRHRGNAEVLRQELLAEQQIEVSLRTVERAVAPWRRELAAEARATVRFETAPGEQLQIDFGEKRVVIGGEVVRVHLFVATLGYSRRNFVMAFDNQRQGSWLRGIEAAFAHFGGVAERLLLDNARALVEEHDVDTREVRYNERFHAFCRYWGVRPQACAPYRARYPGQGRERGRLRQGQRPGGAGIPKLGGIARAPAVVAARGRRRAHPRHHRRAADRTLSCRRGRRAQAPRRQAAVRTGPRAAPARAQRRLRGGRHQPLQRALEVDWPPGARARHWAAGARLPSLAVLAVHAQSSGRRQRSIQREHLEGIVGAWPERQAPPAPVPEAAPPPPPGELQRPLSDYEALLGGGWQ